MSNYNGETINSRNPLARYAHRNRVKRSIALVGPRVQLGRILDYGCGSGVFVSEMLAIKPESAVGYEPFMDERTQASLPIFKTVEEIKEKGPYETVTLFETIEHLSQAE